MTIQLYPYLFKAYRGKLKGRDWLRRVDPDDRAAFVQIGLQHAHYGKLGGVERARSGLRDHKGRFLPN